MPLEEIRRFLADPRPERVDEYAARLETELAGRKRVLDFVRATRTLELVAIGSSVRGSLALNRAARAWAMLNGRKYVTPEDVERLIEPVLMHRLLFRPSFLAEIRDRGWTAAALDVQARCLELAPKPGFDIDLDVPSSAA